jgi:RNA polymerase sigma factor (sigma-70 family)
VTELVHASITEKRRRFEAQVLPHLDAAYNLARWFARSSSDADDIVQEAMLRAYRAFDGVHVNDPKPWLLAIVRNCSFTAASRGRRAVDVPLPDEAGHSTEPALRDQAPDPELSSIQADQSRKLYRIIMTLPTDLREILVLREMEDMSYRDIAEITRVPIGTVMSRLARARALLKDKWTGEMEGVRHGMP